MCHQQRKQSWQRNYYINFKIQQLQLVMVSIIPILHIKSLYEELQGSTTCLTFTKLASGRAYSLTSGSSGINHYLTLSLIQKAHNLNLYQNPKYLEENNKAKSGWVLIKKIILVSDILKSERNSFGKKNIMRHMVFRSSQL